MRNLTEQQELNAYVAELYKETLNTAASAGMSIYSKEFLCRLLAVFYVFGSEAFVLNAKLNAITMHAWHTLRGLATDVSELDRDSFELLKKSYREIIEKRADWLEPYVKDIGLFVTQEIQNYFPGD
jgi:hypothetical protein